MLITEQRAGGHGRLPYRTSGRQQCNHHPRVKGTKAHRTADWLARCPGGKWEMIESYRKINLRNTPYPASAPSRKSTDGGWLTISRTEGYNTPLAQTTLYTYNDQFRVSLEIQPDGGYTRYEYDDQGRHSASNTVGGGEKGTRTTYMTCVSTISRPATEGNHHCPGRNPKPF